MYANIALMSPPYSTLTYKTPEWLPESVWEPCLRAAILLNDRIIRSGVILSLHSDAPNLPDDIQIKPILWPLEKTAILSEKFLSMIRQLALKQAVQPGKILANALPLGLKTVKMQLRLFDNKDNPALIPFAELKNKSPRELKELGVLWKENKLECLAHKEDSALSELCVLNKTPPWDLRSTANRQKALLEFLLKNGSTSKRTLLKTFGSNCSATLSKLIASDFISLVKEYAEEEPGDNLPFPIKSRVDFSPDQKKAARLFEESLLERQSKVFLLFGITGSGKTAVYMETIRICLKQGRSALILAPEIALAHKLKQDLLTIFPEALCYLFHGYQSQRQKEFVFRKAAEENKPLIIVGTRSALFLPVKDLGLIILDEEHDASFKQNDRFVYHAKDIAWFYANEHKAIVILGSATPDIKTFYATENAKITGVYLPNRIGNSVLPQVTLVDIKKSSESLFSTESVDALKETLAKGEQAIVLLNRRGYAPTMYCIDCGTTAVCPYCSISLTYHKKRESLLCHYCGYTKPFPTPCSSCRGIRFYPIGRGTEHIEENLSQLFPYEKILRFDRDTTRKTGETEKILTTFANKEARILVGTQMLSKGYHFPDATLAIVANGDLGLNLPDYRAAEKTFQLLTQSAGRSGRGDKPGRVFIQTSDVSHYCWKFVTEHNYKGFYERELALRKQWLYPPFTCLALLRVSYPATWAEGQEWLEIIQKSVRPYDRPPQLSIRGPAPAPIPIVKRRKRFQWLLKGESWRHIRHVFSQVQTLKLAKHIRASLDIDPVDML